jgi:hypothetical protein
MADVITTRRTVLAPAAVSICMYRSLARVTARALIRCANSPARDRICYPAYRGRMAPASILIARYQKGGQHDP